MALIMCGTAIEKVGDIEMLVFLDSSVLCTDYYMRGTYFELLKRASTIILSEVVIDEVKNKHYEMLVEQLQQINKDVSELNRLLFTPFKIETDDILLREQTAYVDFIEMFLIESGMTIAEPYPDIEHRKIVQRALPRKKPFKGDGRNGYRDYLVWKSFLGMAQAFSSEIACFITLNRKDFSDEQDEKRLHPDLIAELKDLGIDDTRIQYWTSLKEFVDNIIKPQLAESEEREEFENSLLNDKDGFLNPLEAMIFENLNGFDVNHYDVLVPGESPCINTVDDISNIKITKVSTIFEDEYLLEINLDTICSIDSFLSKSELVAMRDYDLRDIQIINANWNEHYVSLETQIGLKIEIEVIYNTNKKAFSAFEISDVSDYNCLYCAYD